MGSCQSKSTTQLGIHPNNSITNGGGIKNMPPSKASTMIGTSGTGIANAIAGAHAAATAAADHGRHDHDDIYDEDDEFESDYYEIKKTGKSSSSLMVDTNMDKNKKDRGLLLQPEDEVDDDDGTSDGTGDDIPKVQIYTTRNNSSSRNSVFFSPVGEQTAATELPTPLSMADGEDNNYSHTTTYSPPQSAIKGSRISINRHVSGRGHNIRSHDKAIKDDDSSIVRDEGFEVIRRLVDYHSPDQRGQAYGDVEEEMTRLSIVPTSPVPSPTTNEFHHPKEQRDDGEDDIMNNTEADERSVLLSTTTTTTPVETTLTASYCAYDCEINCDDSAELPPLHIDDEAIKRIRERLSYLEDEADDDSQIGDDGDEPKLSPDDEAIKRIRERLACLDDDVEEQENRDNVDGRLLPVPARNNSRQLSEIQGDESESKISPNSPALVDLQRKNRASSKVVPYSPRPTTSKRSKVQAVDDEEEEEEDVSNVNRLVDDLNQVTPLVAPPRDTVVSLKDTTESQSSVDPKAIASFNKLKVQVELAAKADEKQRRDKKLQDRRADVNGYKNLWNDYQIIQEQMNETKINDTSRHTPSESLGAVSPQSQQQQEQQRQQNRPGPCDGLLLHDPSTWFVDFRAMSALNHLYDDYSDEDDGDDYTDDDSDEEDDDGRGSANGFSRHSSYTSRTSMSRLSHSDQMSQQQLFQRIAVERKRRSGAYSVGSTKDDVSHSVNNRPSLIINDDDEGKVGGNLSAEKSLSIKYTKSTINGVILPLVSPSGSDDIEVAFDEALEQDNEKTPVNIEDQQREGSLLQNDTSMEDDGPVLNAPTPVASNQAVRPSFSPEYSLPSVKLSIDGNSTGEVRWRNFPVSDQPTTRRKLLFEDEDEVETATEAPKDEQEGRQQKRDDDDENADPLIDNEKARKQIAFLSADQFLRMAL
eukprot:CAMPEP_0113453810 /NCGR_PEP_ID=MMETSP0014_2-20120614/7544_1 /TAXON_ID=2857 /ORGANISM="Nitzschia sp." /LENGTH=925 /DNA_ID=CAMNT_0000345205 /DNA_START=81 /DNA_END=2858 /DNA_ORIENTATION=+ /assembly_acc=CAM_ASM_000159